MYGLGIVRLLTAADELQRIDVRVSEASSDSRNRPVGCQYPAIEILERVSIPGMIYVNDRSADSTCVTEEAFLATKSSYLWSQCDGREIVAGIRVCACL